MKVPLENLFEIPNLAEKVTDGVFDGVKKVLLHQW